MKLSYLEARWGEKGKKFNLSRKSLLLRAFRVSRRQEYGILLLGISFEWNGWEVFRVWVWAPLIGTHSRTRSYKNLRHFPHHLLRVLAEIENVYDKYIENGTEEILSLLCVRSQLTECIIFQNLKTPKSRKKQLFRILDLICVWMRRFCYNIFLFPTLSRLTRDNHSLYGCKWVHKTHIKLTLLGSAANSR